MVKPSPPAKHPSFFKVMLGDFSSILRIPPSFSKHLRENLGVKSVIRGPGGRKWRVKVGRSAAADRWFFQSGWDDFVKHNSIALGDFLVFFYDGDFTFDVRVYGNSGSEKEETCSAAAVDVGKCVATAEKKRTRPRRRQGKPIYVGRTSRGLIRLNCPPLEIEKNVAFQKARQLKPCNPHFVATCRLSRKSYMTIPSALVKEFELDDKGFIVLEDPKLRTWHVTCYHHQDGRVNLTGGWRGFLKANSLEEGDACCFEFIQGGDLVHVHLFRGERNKEESAESTSDGDESIQSTERTQTESDAVNVLNGAESFKSKYPFLTHSCRPSRTHYVAIPAMLARKLTLKKTMILYDPCGRPWPVKVRKVKTETQFGAGWNKFHKGNSLMKGDICIFEFVGGAAVRVNIFRANEVEATSSKSKIFAYD